MTAFAMLAAIRRHGKATTPRPKKSDAGPLAPSLIRWSMQEIRRIAVRLA